MTMSTFDSSAAFNVSAIDYLLKPVEPDRLALAVAKVLESCAIPAFFAPVTIGGVRYVDGGAHSPTNADLVAGLGLDLVVVSSPMSVARTNLRFAPDQPTRRL